MLRLQRYLLGELVGAFVLVLVILTGMFVTGVLLQTLHKYPELSATALVAATPIFLLGVLPITVPLSFLVSCLLTYGRFADDNELLAFQMGGISPWHAAAPAFCAAAFISVGTVELSCDVNPTLMSAKRAVIHGQIREQVARMRSSPVEYVKLEDMEMSWSGRDGEWFQNVFLTWVTSDASRDASAKTKVIHRVAARRATAQLTDEAPLRLVVTLEDAKMSGDAGGSSLTAGRLPIVIDVDEDASLTELKNKDEMRGTELFYRMTRYEPFLDRAKKATEWRYYRVYAGEYWRRIALGLSPLVFALLGVPLGLLARRGSRAAALVLAIFIALPVYYPLLLWGDNLSRSGTLPPAVALNVGNILLGGTGLVLIRRLVTR